MYSFLYLSVSLSLSRYIYIYIYLSLSLSIYIYISGPHKDFRKAIRKDLRTAFEQTPEAAAPRVLRQASAPMYSSSFAFSVKTPVDSW